MTGLAASLAYKGLGEIFVILFFGLVAVLGTILVQIGTAPVVPGTLVEDVYKRQVRDSLLTTPSTG